MQTPDTDDETLRVHNGPTDGPLSVARKVVRAIRSDDESEN
jgi:hypothetical protein